MDRRTMLAATGAFLGTPLMAAVPGERPTRIRHYVIATHDMPFVCDQIYEVLGLPPTPRKPGPGVTEAYGFYSTMMRVGTTMLEIVQPIKPDHHLNAWLAERGGDGGYMVVAQTYDDRALIARAGAEWLKPSRDMMFKGQHMIQFDDRHFGAFFELYQYAPEDNWWGDPLNGPYGDARVASDVIGGDVAVADPAAIAAQAARLFLGEQSGNSVRFGDRTINFVPIEGKAHGLVALDLKAREQARVGDWARIGGVQFRFV
ncbi:hypothetical protein [Sphingomonas sp.]|uniref:hypothetical protein n=1 Tax=Sphingomonas sp. TaxID=28214 RepID=UPI002BBDF7BA|nr:hypothetical protein [Sphingomonas sp.]HWK34859.1 hypothetical protein [Sphingomonas sp.]